MAEQTLLWTRRERRKTLWDPTYELKRTHVFANGDDTLVPHTQFAVGNPTTWGIDIQISGDAPNGVIFEIGRDIRGVALWADNVLGQLGWCAGEDEVAAGGNNGAQGVVQLNHLAATVVVAIGSGTGYVVGDLITLAGGTFATATILRVATLSGSAVATATIEDAGAYSVIPGNPVAQDTTDGVGTGETFTMTYATQNNKYRVVVACIPGDGTIRGWLNGDLVFRVAAVAGSFSSWATGAGALGHVGDVNGTVNTRVPAASRVAASNITIASGLSVFGSQRPQHYYG